MSVDLGGGTKEKQARRCGKRAWFVPVSIADEVTKRTWSSPKALTASRDRCYCRRQSNTTGSAGRRQNDKRVQRRYREQHLVQAHTDTREGGTRVQMEARGEKQEVTHTFLHLLGFASSF